ncbi:hypothetical protein KFE25_011725 [Diacronema lutheri]|uniref:Ribonuclease M5 C-terminal domain-containing protein n=1 Tax=Diacronema lutheri TaxID=2081491 RepID=A0A8J5XBG8_DIALT|nr:hypothetical protein KFE25_011725 [Diacronema lutheri]
MPARPRLRLLFLCAAGLCARGGVPGPVAARSRPLQPSPRGLIIVEGHADARAVRRAIRDAVVIHTNGKGLLDGKSGAGSLLVTRVRQAGSLPTVLTDPDLTGLELRNHIDGLLGGECLHAFLPARYAKLRQGAPREPGAGAAYKETGDLGVQHARPECIIAALRAARRSDATRAEFSAELLLAAGLTAPFDAPDGHGAGRLRHALCDALGLGRCNGKQLLRQLNRYGFTREEVNAVLAEIDNGAIVEETSAEAGPARAVRAPVQLAPAQGVQAWPAPPPQQAAPRASAAPSKPAAALQKVMTDRPGILPVQYAGPSPAELLQLYREAEQARATSGASDDDDDDDDGDWSEGWEEWELEGDGEGGGGAWRESALGSLGDGARDDNDDEASVGTMAG